jgi:hypothetical protein
MIILASICLTYPSGAEFPLPTVDELRPFLPAPLRSKKMSVQFAGATRMATLPDGTPVSNVTYRLRLE